MPRKDERLNNTVEGTNDRIADASIRHMLYLEGLKTRQSRELIKYIDKEIIPKLKADIALRLEKSMRGTVTTARLEKLVAKFERITDDFKNINKRIQADMIETAIYELEFQERLLAGNIPIEIEYTIPTAETLTAAVLDTPFDGKTIDQWYAGLASGVRERIQSEIRRGVVEGQTAPQIARRINQSNVLDVARRHIDTLSRTAINHTVNTTRNELFKANSDIIKKVRWTSTLDSRTSSICKSLDGKTWGVDDPHPVPPAHPNCRSAIVPVTKSWREMGVDIDEIEPEKRVSMNGRVPSDIKYGDWLKKQSVAVQNDALGVTKAKLFRDGGLTVDKFVNRNGFEFNLSELKKRESAAFEKAGL